MVKQEKSTKPREYVDPRMTKATLILRKMLNSFRTAAECRPQLKIQA